MDRLAQITAELNAARAGQVEREEIPRLVHLLAIRDRLEAATGGPWYPVDLRHQQGGQIRIFSEAPASGIIANVLRSGPRPAADGALIGNAQQDLAFLLAEVERLRTKLGSLTMAWATNALAARTAPAAG